MLGVRAHCSVYGDTMIRTDLCLTSGPQWIGLNIQSSSDVAQPGFNLLGWMVRENHMAAQTEQSM